MVKREDTYAEALRQKQQLRERNRAAAEIMRAAAYEQLPRLGEIDRELAALGSQIALTAISGDSAGLETLKGRITALSEEKSGLLKKAQVKETKAECQKCGDTGYLPDGRLCSCVKTLAKKIFTERLSREMPLSECRFDNFNLNYYPDGSDGSPNVRKKMTAILKLCREYVLHFSPESSPNLLFMGETGLGKTHLTLSIVSGVIEKGYDVIYGSAFNLLSQVEQEQFSGSGSKESYNAMLSCDLLVIDDLGTEFITPFAQTTIYNLINTRLLSKKPTIINTNLSMAEIENRYTERIASRLIGCYTARRFSGSDVRQLKAMEKRP